MRPSGQVSSPLEEKPTYRDQFRQLVSNETGVAVTVPTGSVPSGATRPGGQPPRGTPLLQGDPHDGLFISSALRHLPCYCSPLCWCAQKGCGSLMRPSDHAANIVAMGPFLPDVIAM